MSIVSVDDRGRMTIPKEMGLRDTRAVIIQAGSYIIAIPLPKDPRKAAEGWLDTDKTTRELKNEAENLAQEESSKRHKSDHRV